MSNVNFIKKCKKQYVTNSSTTKQTNNKKIHYQNEFYEKKQLNITYKILKIYKYSIYKLKISETHCNSWKFYKLIK
jgi:hypothetical protein